MSDTISRKGVFIPDITVEMFRNASLESIEDLMASGEMEDILLPPAQPKQTDCEYCHEDSDGYVRPLEKNCHAFVRHGINGWEISLKAKGWSGSAKIKYCPMCGRELKHE